MKNWVAECVASDVNDFTMEECFVSMECFAINLFCRVSITLSNQFFADSMGTFQTSWKQTSLVFLSIVTVLLIFTCLSSLRTSTLIHNLPLPIKPQLLKENTILDSVNYQFQVQGQKEQLIVDQSLLKVF